MGGTVAGPLEAATPVTVVVGHWDPDRTPPASDLDQAAQGSAPSSTQQLGLAGLVGAAAAGSVGGQLLGLAAGLAAAGYAGGWQPDDGLAAAQDGQHQDQADEEHKHEPEGLDEDGGYQENAASE